MRRVATGLAACLCTVTLLGACDGDGGDAESPLDDALGYLPADIPLAAAISTDLESDAFRDLDVALQRFGLPGGVDGYLEGLGEYQGVTFSDDVQPLLGNELVLGVPSVSELENLERFVLAVRVTDGDELRDLLSGLEFLEERDEIDGATVFGPALDETEEGTEVEGPGVAVEGDMLVVAESEGAVEEALRQRDEDDRLTEDTFLDRLGGLPDEGILRVAGDVPAAIEALGIEQVATLPWVESQRSFGLVAAVEGRTLTVDAAISGEAVDPAELPLDAGPASPRIFEDRPTVATRDQAQTIEFAIAAIRASVPSAAFDDVAGQLEERLGISLESLSDQFGEGLVAELEGGETVTRTVVDDPAAVADALEELRDEVPRLAEVASAGGVAGEALEFGRFLIPALPVPEEQFFPADSEVVRVPSEPDLYRLLAPRPEPPPSLEQPVPPGVEPPPPPPLTPTIDRAEFVFGIIGGVLVTAPSVEAAREAAETRPSTAELPPGALGFRIPVEASDFGLPGAPDVIVTTIEGGVEASPTVLRLHAEASL
jgi:hypothetical protein